MARHPTTPRNTAGRLSDRRRPDTWRTMRVLPALLVCVIALAGCGVSDDRAQSRAVTERFLAAFEEENGLEACGQLSASTVKELESQEQQPCAQAVTELELEGGAVVRTDVYVTNAKVDLSSGESVFLNREPTGWKLAAVGCKSTEGPPRDEPLDCELEA
jgi:hypothetical protein